MQLHTLFVYQLVVNTIGIIMCKYDNGHQHAAVSDVYTPNNLRHDHNTRENMYYTLKDTHQV